MRAEELLDAWDQGLDPLKDQPVLGAPKTAEDIVDDWDAENGGFFSGLKDMGVYALSAVPTAVQGVVDVGRMATGDADVLKNFSDWIGEQTDSFKDFALSDAALAQQRRLDRMMADPNYSIADLPSVIAANPRATLGSAVESVGSMVVPTGMGVAAVRGVGQLGRLAQAGRGGSLARILGNISPTKAAAVGSMVGNAALNAADTYTSDALENQDQADRYLGALVSGGTSLVGSKVTGGGAENILAQLFSGNAARQIGQSAARRAVTGLISGGGREFGQEFIEEGGNIAGESVGSGTPIDWNNALKRQTFAGTLGAILGGPIGMTSGIAAKPQAQNQQDAAQPQGPQQDPQAALDALGELFDTAAQSQQAPAPQTTQRPQVTAQQPQKSQQAQSVQQTPTPQPEIQPRAQTPVQAQPQVQTQPQDAQTQQPAVENVEPVSQQNTQQPNDKASVVLQNRNRSNKASIEQMDRIAGNPDYGRVGIGRDFANGAPVVAYGSVPDKQKGRVDYATAATGERIPIQYAVVEADTVSTSHDIGGNKNPNYGRQDLVTAIAGNGRVTGIAAAYRKGTAAKYRQELTEDSAMHGVNPEIINGMRNPVLVRIMPNERVTGNIGDLSNTTGNNSLNAVEKAHNDANRVNFEGMEFNEDGSPTQESIVDFIRGMPSAERAELIDEHGRPNSQAIDRLNNAIFARAYGNDDVIAMYAMAVDPEAKLVINTLSAVAPKMARLEGCGELDFRDVLIQAVNQIVEGKRKGLKMQDIVKQVDAFTDPDISLFLDLFAKNPRSNKQVIEVLSDAADFAYNEATRDTETEDMFGGVQPTTRADLMQHIQETNNQITELRNAQRRSRKRNQASDLQNSEGSVSSGKNASGRNAGTNPSQNESRGSSDAQGNEGFSLQGQTADEIEADVRARDEAEAQRVREEAQNQQRQEAQNLRNEVTSLNEGYADNFSLTDNNTSAEDALRGQGDLRFSRNPETAQPDIKFSVAWHGSPYVFDTFASEHIGTGTGRATYGWGLYFTGDRQVAEKYRDSTNPDGSLFRVEIPDDDVLLDSDAEFAQQPQKVRDAINKLYEEEYDELPPPDWWYGRQIYQDIILREEGYTDPDDIPGDYEIDMDNDELAGNARLASEKLNSIGVKGVKFIGDDEDTGYVIFDDKAIKVLDRFTRFNNSIQINPETNKQDLKLSVAWHGSPHVFDTFASDHIGSGEGAQVHGWGLYFAQDREVAEGYRRGLAGSDIQYRGKNITELYTRLERNQEYDKLAVIEEFMINQSIPDIRSNARELIDDGIFTQEAYDWFEREVVPNIQQPGRLFEVQIPESSQMLDEDKLFYEQPIEVLRSLSKLTDWPHAHRARNIVEIYDRANQLGGEALSSEVLKQINHTIGRNNGEMSEETYNGLLRAFNNDEVFVDKIVNFCIDEHHETRWGSVRGGRWIYEDLIDHYGSDKAASQALNSAGIEGITYNGQEDGRCYVVFDDNAIEVLNYYSKIQGNQQGSTVESITQTLSNDSDIGEAFRNLSSRGSVVVIQSENELPGYSMASRSAKTDPETNYQNGLLKLQEALRNRTSVKRVAFNSELNGWIDVDWGKLGEIIDAITFQTKGAMGLSHIIDKRSVQVPLSPEQVAAVLRMMVRTMVNGTQRRDNHGRRMLVYKGFRVGINKVGGNHYVVSAMGSYKTEAAPSGHLGTATPIPATLQARNDYSPGTRSRNVSALADIILENELLIKRSADDSIQGAYDPRTQKVYLVADNLTDENARAVFMHEVGVHMAADGDMKAVFARAKQIVWNGSANGDKVAQAAKRRMDAAGETSPEEAAAYLVEEAVKAQKDLPKSHPIVQWLEDLMRRIRLWINKKLGVTDLPGLRLTTDDIVSVAMANAKSLGNVERKPSNGMTTFADNYRGEWRERRGDLRTKKDSARSIWSRNMGLNSGWGAPIQRDELGRRKLAWGEHIATGIGNMALDAAEAMIPALRTKYAMRMAPKEVREMYRELRAQVDNAKRKAGKVAEEMAKWSDNDRRLISDVIEKALDADAHPPEHVLKMASMMSDLMTQQGQDLVNLGMLSEEAFNRWRGQYLPRFYNRRKELDGEGWFKNFMKRGVPLRGVGGGSLKGRGKYELIEVKDLDKYIREGWEVRDERYTFNKEAKESQPELAFKDMPNVEVDEHQTVNVWRDWTPKERQEMGEIRDAGYRFVMGYMQMQEDLALGRLFKQIAENPAWTRNTPSEGYSAVPDAVIPETGGVKRYGALAGKYVKDEVLAQVMPHAEVPSAFTRAYRNLLSYWKEGKTALNPVSHMNNTAGNIIMAHLAGVNMWDARAYLEIRKAFKENADWLKEAGENGLFTGSFSKEEIAKLLPEEYTKLESKQESLPKQGFEFVFNYMLNYGLRKKMRNLYDAEDCFFKALIYKYAKDHGMSTKDAIDYALGFIPTYDDLPGGARAIRDSAIPFFAWTYKIVPRLALTMVTYPHRFLAPAALMWTANMLSYAIAAGDDDDDWWTRIEKGQKLRETEEGLLPEYMQGMGAMFNPKFLRLWNDPTTNLPVYWNIGNFIPGGQMFDLTNQAGGIPRPEMLAVGTPLYTLWAAMGLNVDTFTGREITKDSDTVAEAAEKRATYMWRQLAPALAYGGYHFERVLNGLANATGDSVMGYTGIGRNGQAVTPLNAAINTMGLKVRNVDFQKEFSFKISDIQRENREILVNIRSLSRYIKQGSINPLEGQEEIENQREKLKDNAARAKEFTRLNKDRKQLSNAED